MNKKVITTLCLLFLAVVFGYVYHATRQQNTDKSSVVKFARMIGTDEDIPIIVAQKMKIFDKHEISVEIVPFSSETDMIQAITTNRVDLAVNWPSIFIFPIAKGAPIKIIAPLTKISIHLFTRPNEIKTINDLVGRKVATKIGGGPWFALRSILKSLNIGFDKVEFVELSGEFRPIALLTQKTVDAVLEDPLKTNKYLRLGAVVLEEWQTKGYLDKLFPDESIAANTNFLSDHKQEAEAFINALIESEQYIATHPDEAAEIMFEQLNEEASGESSITVQDIKDGWSEGRVLCTWYDPAEIVEIAKVLKDNGDISKELTKDDIFYSGFEDKLKLAQLKPCETQN